MQSDCEKSFIAGIELISDNSQIAILAGSLKFYRLDVTPLNAIETWRRVYICSESIVTVHVLARFVALDD